MLKRFDTFVKFCFEHGDSLKNHKSFGEMSQEIRSSLKTPRTLNTFMYALLKEARRNSFVDFCKDWGIDYEDDYPEIEKWFEQFGIKL